MPKIHLPMQFSTEGAGKMGKLYRTSQSFKVAAEAHRHIGNDDRLQESDKSKVNDSRNKISVTFCGPLWRIHVLRCCCAPCFYRLDITWTSRFFFSEAFLILNFSWGKWQSQPLKLNSETQFTGIRLKELKRRRQRRETQSLNILKIKKLFSLFSIFQCFVWYLVMFTLFLM